MAVKRRRFLGLSAGVLALGCGGLALPGERARDEGGPPVTVPASGPAPTDFALRSEVPGFRAVSSWSGAGAAPVLVQLMLNINDFMRVDQEAAAVSRWLDLLQARQLWPAELSFTGHVLAAFVAQAPDLVARIRSARPTITEHYRILKYKHINDTEHELFYTDPATLALDRSRAGPCVLIQQSFGVTPRDEGGALGALLRKSWVQGKQTASLRALGFAGLQRQDQVGHPDRIIAMALPDPGPTDPHAHVEAYLRLRRLQAQLMDGKEPASADLDDLYRWAQWAHEQGFDVTAVPGLSDLIDVSSLPDFIAGFGALTASSASHSAWQARPSADAQAALTAALRGLAQRTSTLPGVQAELAFKLSRLDPTKVYVSRLAWHASNDYTAEAWGQHMSGRKGTMPLPLTPAGTRSLAQQQAIQAAAAGLLDTLVASGRVQAASMDGDSQWSAVNAPAMAYPDLLGVAFDRVPGSLSADRVDAAAVAAGIHVKPARRAGNGRGNSSTGGGRGGGGKHHPRRAGDR